MRLKLGSDGQRVVRARDGRSVKCTTERAQRFALLARPPKSAKPLHRAFSLRATLAKGSYAGAPHSFFDRRFEEHAEASEDASRRVLEFIRANAPVSSGRVRRK
jgi:dienelactone hydrolase